MAVVKISTKFGTTPITVDPGDVAPAYDLSAIGSGAFKYGQLMFKHYKIAPSVSSDNLTVALQHLDGSNASATRPLFFMINGSLRSVTAALSVTMNAGTNWMNAGAAEFATYEIDYFVYIGYNATDGVVLGVSRIPFAAQYNDFSATSTNEKYARISTITTAAATDPYQVIGRYAATLSAGAGYTWTVPTYTPVNLIQRPIFNTRAMSWSSQPTNVTVGNGTKEGFYLLNNRSVSGFFKFTLGSTSSVDGAARWSTPFLKNATYYPNGVQLVNVLRMVDSGTAAFQGAVNLDTTGANFRLLAVDSSATYITQTDVIATVPYTWTTSDSMEFPFDYLI